MNLLERYLQAIGPYLPSVTRADVLAELRANLLEQIDARAEDLQRPLNESELSDLLRAHGRPEVVAARYLQQRSLIGPAIFPTYLLAIRRALPIAIVIYFVAIGANLLLDPVSRSFGAILHQAISGLISTLFFFFAIVTMAFAAIEYLQSTHNLSVDWSKWDPAKLPELSANPEPKQRSLAGRTVDLVVHCLWIAYVLLLPSHPYLIFGPGLQYVRELGLTWSPAWHTFYTFLVVIIATQLCVKIAALVRSSSHWQVPLDMLSKLLGVVALWPLALTRTYLVPSASVAPPAQLPLINQSLHLAFCVVLLIVMLQLVLNLWVYFRPSSGSASLAF